MKPSLLGQHYINNDVYANPATEIHSIYLAYLQHSISRPLLKIFLAFKSDLHFSYISMVLPFIFH